MNVMDRGEELSRQGWTESDLAVRRRSNPGKLGSRCRRIESEFNACRLPDPSLSFTAKGV